MYELINTPRRRQDAIALSQLSVADALTALVTLELKGLAKEEFGKWRRT